MVWIVKLDNPKPESYVTVYERTSINEDEFLSPEKYQVFDSKSDAIKKARSLLCFYSVISIRFFYEEGYSRNIKISK